MSSRRVRHKFRIYVADNTQNSEAARANLQALCRTYLENRYEIEVVDVLREPERALKDGIFMTPTLVRLWPAPVRRIVGTLADPKPVLQILGLESVTA
jgi:circadian clock protein KaiB